MEAKPQKWAKNIPWFVSWPSIVLGCLISVFLFQRYIGFLVTVDGQSMCPTLEPKMMVFARSTASGVIPRRGDIVILNDGDCLAIKRIVGVQGDTLKFTRGGVFINGCQLCEPYLPKGVATYPEDVGNDIHVGRNEYLVLGDNRAVSLDG